MVSRGASYLTIQTVATSAAQAVSFAIIARIITTSQMGILAVMSLVVALALAIDGSAFQQSASKFIGEVSAHGQNEIASSVFYQTLRISAFISFPLAAIVYLEAPALSLALLGQVTFATLFRFLGVDILVYAGVLPVASGTLIGLRRFKAVAAIGVAGAMLRQGLIISLVLFMNDFTGLVIAWVLSDFFLVAVYLIYIYRIVGRPQGAFSARRLISFSWPLSLSNIISFAYTSFDRTLLVMFVPLAALGMYNVALTALSVLGGISSAVSNALLPVYSRISSRSNDRLESCRHATFVASRYVSLVIVPLAFGLVATAKPALTLFVGQAYVDGTIPLMILTLFFGLTLFGAALGPMLVAMSETRVVSGITVISVLVGLASAMFLLPFLGIVGASVARSLALIISTALTMIVLARKKAMRLDANMVWKSLLACGVMSGVLFGIQAVIYSRLLLPIYIVVGCLVYLLSLRFLRVVKKEDVDLIGRYLGNRLGFTSRLLGMIVLSDKVTNE